MRISVIFLFLVLPLLSAAAPAHFNHGHSTRPKRPNDTILRSYSRAHILRQRYPAAVSKPAHQRSEEEKGIVREWDEWMEKNGEGSEAHANLLNWENHLIRFVEANRIGL